MKCKECGKEFDCPAWSEFKHSITSWGDDGSGRGSWTTRYAPTCPHCNFPIYNGNTEINYPSASGYLPEQLRSSFTEYDKGGET